VGRHLAGRACLCCVFALMATSCATPPAVKRNYLDVTAWRGATLTGVGRQMVVDAAAGAAPQTVTLLDVNGRAEVVGDVERRARVLDWRVANVQRELHRNGIAPTNIDDWPGAGWGGVQTYPPWELQTKQMVVIAHY
jgi:hypothetical protein